jgi:hypothetical protein
MVEIGFRRRVELARRGYPEDPSIAELSEIRRAQQAKEMRRGLDEENRQFHSDEGERMRRWGYHWVTGYMSEVHGRLGSHFRWVPGHWSLDPEER